MFTSWPNPFPLENVLTWGWIWSSNLNGYIMMVNRTLLIFFSYKFTQVYPHFVPFTAFRLWSGSRAPVLSAALPEHRWVGCPRQRWLCVVAPGEGRGDGNRRGLDMRQDSCQRHDRWNSENYSIHQLTFSWWSGLISVARCENYLPKCRIRHHKTPSVLPQTGRWTFRFCCFC